METSKSDKYFSYDEAIALTKIGTFHYVQLIICGFCIFAMMTEVSGLSLIMAAAKCDLHFTVVEQGLLGSSGFIGIVLGSQVLGILADNEGRRQILVVSMFISICSSAISSVAVNTSMLIVFRILNGFFVSSGQSVMFSYLSEFHSNKTRVRFITLAACFLPVSAIYFPALAMGVLPLQIHGFSSWRLYILLNTIPSWLAFLGLLFLPEGPKFLLTTKNNYKECLRILIKIYTLNNGNPGSYPVKYICSPEGSDSKNKKVSKLKQISEQICEIFARERIFQTLNFCTVTFAMSFVGLGIYMWLPITISFYLEDTKDHFDMCTVIEHSTSRNRTLDECSEPVKSVQFQILAYIGICFTVFYVLISQMVKILDKKVLFSKYMLSKVMEGTLYRLLPEVKWISFYMCWISIGGAFAIAMHWITNMYVVIISLTLIVAIPNISGVLNAMVAEYYPTQVSALALSLILTFNKFGAIIGTMVIGSLLMSHCEALFFGLGITVFVTVGLVYFLPDGKEKNSK